MPDIFLYNHNSIESSFDLDQLNTWIENEVAQQISSEDKQLKLETKLSELLNIQSKIFPHFPMSQQAQLIRILKSFKPYYTPSDKLIPFIYKALSETGVDDAALYDWIYTSPHFDVNSLNFSLKADKHFYFYILEKLVKAHKQYNDYLSQKDDIWVRTAHASALSFFRNQKVDANVFQHHVRPMDFFLSSIERQHQTQYSKLILAYYEKNPEVIGLKNNMGRKMESYLLHEHLVQQIYAIKNAYSSENVGTTPDYQLESLGFLARIWQFFFPTPKSKTTGVNDKGIGQALISAETPATKENDSVEYKFALQYVALSRLFLELQKSLKQNNLNSELTEESLLNHIQSLLTRYLALFDNYHKQLSTQSLPNPGMEFFITKQFPQFLTGSLSSYLQALSHLSSEDFMTAHNMLVENIQLMGQHLAKQEEIFTVKKENDALIQMKVENKYLTNTMGR